MHTLVQQQVPVQRKDVHSAASIHDLSSKSEALQRKADLVGGSAVVQMKTAAGGLIVEDLSMAKDLLHEEYAALFSAESIQHRAASHPRGGWTTRNGGNIARWLNSEDSQNPGQKNRNRFKYNRLRGELLTRERLNPWLSTHGEHMYVHCGDDIKIATRQDDEKLPHPTLVGGDPIVKGAGTMYKNRGIIYITKKSGHFRPNFIHNDTLTKVSSMGETVRVDPRLH